MANEAKQFTIGGVTHDVMDVGARQAIASLQNAIDAITSGDTTTAIKTFQEVIDFLDGVTDDATLIGKLNELRTLINEKYSKPASGIPASDLANGVIPDVSVFATKSELNAKANSADVVPNSRTINGKALSSNVTIGMSDIQGLETAIADAGKVKSVSVNGGTARTPDGNGNVNVVVPTVVLDDAPTAGSNNAVKSGGVKTALDAKANADDVPTKTEMADAIDDAFGEAQVTVVPAGSVGIISSLGSDSDEDALSASMGKKLKIALLQLYSSLGIYAFPNGKPQLDFGGDSSVTYTVQKTIGTGLSATGGDTDVEMGDTLEVSIAIIDNLYIVDDDSVVVTMDGQPVAGAWNASTMKVTIAAVTGDVVINVPSMTYVGYGEQNSPLVFMLDAKNGIDLATNKWTDLVGDVEFSLTNVTLNQAGTAAVFNGSTSKGVASVALNWSCINGTIESVFTRSSTQVKQPVFFSGKNKGFAMCGWKRGSDSKLLITSLCTTESETDFNDLAGKAISTQTDVLAVAISMNIDRKLLNGLPKTDTTTFDTWQGILDQFAVIGNSRRTSGDSYLNGTISCIRIYDGKKLTQAEQEQNYKVDKKRFNLA